MSFFPGSMSNFVPIDFEGRPLTSTGRLEGAAGSRSADSLPHHRTSNMPDHQGNHSPPYTHPQRITSAMPTNSPVSHTSRSGARTEMAANSQELEKLLQKALLPITTRLENIERGNNDPFDDVKDALHSIETYRQHLSAELSQKYQDNANQLEQATKSITTWHSSLQDEVTNYCDERNRKLHDASNDIFARLDALEQVKSRSYGIDQAQERSTQDTLARLEALTNRLDGIEASTRGRQELFREAQLRTAQVLKLHENRIANLAQAMQKSSATPEHALKCAGAERQQDYYDEMLRAHQEVTTRLSKLEQGAEPASQALEVGDRLSNIESSLRQVQEEMAKHRNDVAKSATSDQRLDDLQQAIEDVVGRNGGHEKTEPARYRQLEQSLRSFDSRLDGLDQALRARSCEDHSQSIDGGQTMSAGSSHGAAGDGMQVKIEDLARRVEEYYKATHKRFDFLIKQLPGIKEQDPAALRRVSKSVNAQQEVTTSSKTNSNSNLEATLTRAFQSLEQRLAPGDTPQPIPSDRFLWPTTARVQALEDKIDTLSNGQPSAALEERLVQLESTTAGTDLQQRIDNSLRQGDVQTTELTKRLEKLEKDDPTRIAKALEHLSTRMTNIESASLTAALDARFQSFSEQMAKVGERLISLDNREEFRVLAEKVAQNVGTGGDGISSAQEYHELRRRLKNLETHVTTSASNHSTSRSESADLGARITVLEQETGNEAIAAEARTLADRLSKVESSASEERLQQRLDALSARQIATLTDLVGRTGTLEGSLKEMLATSRTTAKDMQDRIVSLENNSVAAVVDRRFESFAETLTKVREHVAADGFKSQLTALSERISKFEQHGRSLDREEDQGSGRQQLLDKINALKRELHILQAASEKQGDCVNRLISDVDDVDEKADRTGAALTELARDTSCLTVRHDELDKPVIDLKETTEQTRDWIGRVSRKSERDDREILGAFRIHDNEHNLRLGSAEGRLERLQDDLRAVQSVNQAAQSQNAGDLADDIRRLRHRIEEAEPDDNARRQLSDLFRVMLDGSFLPARKALDNPVTNESRSKDHGRQYSAGKRSISADEVGALIGDDRLAPRTELEVISQDPIAQPPAKRRRVRDDEGDGHRRHAEVRALRQTAAPGDEVSEDGEDQTPRRSDRKGRGQNERLDSMPGMITGIDWKNAMMKKPRTKA